MPNVVVYSQPGCSYCDLLKSYLEKQGVTYEDHNVREDEDALKLILEEYHARGTPVIVVDGEVVLGFDKARLDELLGAGESSGSSGN